MIKQNEIDFLLSLFIGLKSNQKRLLNFYKELAIASLCAHVTADELSLRAMALLLGCQLRPSSADAGAVSRRAASPLTSQHSSV
jgi:hypothetical protein